METVLGHLAFAHANLAVSCHVDDQSDPSWALGGDRPAASSSKALGDWKELSATAFQRTRMPMVVTDPRQPDNPVVLANQAFLDLSGYNAGEVIGRNCRFLQGQGTSRVAVAEIRAAVTEQREADVELLNYRKDGSAFWNQLHLSPISDDDGRLLYFFASQIDVTKYRKIQSLEASEHRLMMEVDHRARNVLAIVNSIVRLSRSDNSAEYASAVQQRVRALALAHTLLSDRRWTDVSFLDLIVQQIKPYGVQRVTLKGPQVLIPPLVVQPLALVIHELIANAVVHGALSNASGGIVVEWQDVSQDGKFELRWVERDGPIPASDRPNGFGIPMLTGMVEQQLAGAIQFGWRQEGLMVVMKMILRGPQLTT